MIEKKTYDLCQDRSLCRITALAVLVDIEPFSFLVNIHPEADDQIDHLQEDHAYHERVHRYQCHRPDLHEELLRVPEEQTV